MRQFLGDFHGFLGEVQRFACQLLDAVSRFVDRFFGVADLNARLSPGTIVEVHHMLFYLFSCHCVISLI